jgi:two-component system, chemotaxis family, sensor kinase CheA
MVPPADATRAQEADSQWMAALATIPEAILIKAFRSGRQGKSLHLLTYSPQEECFFQGDDPFFQAQRTPGILWGGVTAREPWPKPGELDAYRCILDFHILSEAGLEELNDHYRYVLDQLRLEEVPPAACILPQGDLNGGPVYDDFVAEALELLQRDDRQQLALAAESMLELSNPELWFSSALRWLLVVLEFADSQSEDLRAIITSLLTLTRPQFASPGAVAGSVPMPRRVTPAVSPRLIHVNSSPPRRGTIWRKSSPPRWRFSPCRLMNPGSAGASRA